MSIIWADGFDHYGTDETKMLDGAYAQVQVGSHTNGLELSTGQPRNGTAGMRIIGGGPTAPILRKVFVNGAITAAGVAFSLYMPHLPSIADIIYFRFLDFANAEQLTLSVQTTGALRVFRGATSLGTTTGPVLTANAHHHIEFYAEFSQTVGKVRVRVNNAEVLSLDNQDTVNTSLVEASQFMWSAATNSLSQAQAIDAGYQYYIDDVYFYDTNGSHANAYPVGDLQALLLTATADTAEADWDKSTGSDGFALIDEATPNDADYISADASTDRSDFAMTDLPAEINYVETLFSHARALKSDAGPAQLQQSFMQGADQSAGTDRAITTAATYWFDNHPEDPTTDALWTRAGVNSALLRYDRTA